MPIEPDFSTADERHAAFHEACVSIFAAGIGAAQLDDVPPLLAEYYSFLYQCVVADQHAAITFDEFFTGLAGL